MQEYLGPLRTICAALPDAYEELAWVGVRWRIRTRTFAHVLPIEDGRPASYAGAAGTDGPAVVLTFRSAGAELAALTHAGPPYFVAHFGRDVAGLRLAPGVDWTEVAELLTESYCLLAPRTLAAAVRSGTAHG